MPKVGEDALVVEGKPVPGTLAELDPAFADMPIVRKRIDNAKLSHVLSNSFGFGGTNAALLFKRYQG